MSTTLLSQLIRAALVGALAVAAQTQTLHAQYQDIGTLLRAGESDATLLMREYLKPVGKGLGGNLNTGWFSRAGTRAPLGIDLTVNASVSLVPAAGQVMDLSELDFQHITCVDGQSNAVSCPDSPTLAGEDEPGATIGSLETVELPGGGERRLFETVLPEGSGYPYIPSPMLQLSVGVPGDLDLSLRYLPQVGMGDARVDLLGAAVKHRINRWLPGGNRLPVDISLQAGYTRLNTHIDLDVQPEVDAQTENPHNASVWEGQRASLETSGLVVNALVGKDFPFISVYGGVGYQQSQVVLGTTGNYPALARNPDFDPNRPQGPDNQPKIVDALEDPVSLDFKNSGSLRATAGFSLHLWIFNLNAAYTHSTYPVLRAGLGVSIR